MQEIHKISEVAKVLTKKLEGLPFSSAKDLKIAQKNLNLLAQKRVEIAKAIYLMSSKSEYKFWIKKI